MNVKVNWVIVGGANKKRAGRVLQGKTWDEYPKAFVVRKLQLV